MLTALILFIQFIEKSLVAYATNTPNVCRHREHNEKKVRKLLSSKWVMTDLCVRFHIRFIAFWMSVKWNYKLKWYNWRELWFMSWPLQQQLWYNTSIECWADFGSRLRLASRVTQRRTGGEHSNAHTHVTNDSHHAPDAIRRQCQCVETIRHAANHHNKSSIHLLFCVCLFVSHVHCSCPAHRAKLVENHRLEMSFISRTRLITTHSKIGLICSITWPNGLACAPNDWLCMPNWH